MTQLTSSWQTLFYVLFIISAALIFFICVKYLYKYCRRIERQRNAGTEEVILPLQYSSETTTSSVLHNNFLLPSPIRTTTTSEYEHGEQIQEEEEEEEEVLLLDNRGYFQELPTDVLLHIMSFLPLASIGPLVGVCKSWSDVLRDPQNMDLFLGRKPLGTPNHDPMYLFEECNSARRCTDLYILDSMKVSKLDFGKKIYIAASCSGFICCSSRSREPTIFLCNPLTEEFVKLPELPDIGQAAGYPFFGLGIDITCKKPSKLVRMVCRNPKESRDTECEVYTFGSNSWRSIGVSKFRPWIHAVLHNWKLYWMVCANPPSLMAPFLAFDLENEKFSLVSPPDKKKGHKLTVSYLVKFGDELGCIDQYEDETRVYVIEDDVTMVWSLRYCITCTRWTYHGLWINDALFVKDSHGTAYYYDPHEMNVQEICVPSRWKHDTSYNRLVGQYFPNLLSPKIFWS